MVELGKDFRAIMKYLPYPRLIKSVCLEWHRLEEIELFCEGSEDVGEPPVLPGVLPQAGPVVPYEHPPFVMNEKCGLWTRTWAGATTKAEAHNPKGWMRSIRCRELNYLRFYYPDGY